MLHALLWVIGGGVLAIVGLYVYLILTYEIFY